MTDAPVPDDLSYEQARDELVTVVQQLEAGGTTLEQSIALWERGEQLAAICQRWLDGARARLDAVLETRDDAGEPSERVGTASQAQGPRTSER